MKICTNCGNKMLDTDQVCPICSSNSVVQVDANDLKKVEEIEYSIKMKNAMKQSPKKGKKRGCLIALAIFLGIIVVGCMANLGASAKPANAPSGDANVSDSQNGEAVPEAPETISISATDLFDAYEENEVNADNLYKGQLLEISGTVGDIGKDILDDTYITFSNGEWTLFSVQCYFSDNDEIAKVAQLKKGDTITVIGKCNGMFGNVLIKKCSIK